jgi:cell division septal protein FtsQ
MKRKTVRRSHRRAVRRNARPTEQYLMVVRGWMLVVAFALMLGVGAIVGSYISEQLNVSVPQVAGATITR